MFALIIAIIAIALTVYLAVSTLFYGGDALSNGSSRAVASAFINQGQQINGAATLYKNENAGATVTDLSTLVTGKFLLSVPAPTKGSAWAITTLGAVDGSASTQPVVASNYTAGSPIPDEVCAIIATQAGSNKTFGCTGADTTADATDNKVWYRL